MDFSNLNSLGVMAAIAAVTTATAAAWRYANSIWLSISKYAIDEIQLYCKTEHAAAAYWLIRNTKPAPFSPRLIRGWSVILKGSKRTKRIVAESPTDGLWNTSLRWYRTWWPVWVQIRPRSSHEDGKIRFLRGTLDVRAVVRQMVEEYEALVHDEHQQILNNIGRHRVEIFRSGFGQDPGRDRMGSQPHAVAGGPTEVQPRDDVNEGFVDGLSLHTSHFLNCSPADILRGADPRDSRLVDVALPKDGEDLPKELMAWLKREAWYASRQIPWRRGWLFYGRPGTGKTKLLRSLAADAGLPLFLIDLNGLNNADLDGMWQAVGLQTPCIVVFEDLDTIFQGRTNMSVTQDTKDVYSRGSHVTFDALLQCLDGVKPAHGILTVITTNHPEHIDAALGEYDPATNKVKCRPGRIDRAVFFDVLQPAGKRLIIDRILPDWTEEERQKVADDAGLVTGAEMQEICTALALERQEREGVFQREGDHE